MDIGRRRPYQGHCRALKINEEMKPDPIDPIVQVDPIVLDGSMQQHAASPFLLVD